MFLTGEANISVTFVTILRKLHKCIISVVEVESCYRVGYLYSDYAVLSFSFFFSHLRILKETVTTSQGKNFRLHLRQQQRLTSRLE